MKNINVSEHIYTWGFWLLFFDLQYSISYEALCNFYAFAEVRFVRNTLIFMKYSLVQIVIHKLQWLWLISSKNWFMKLADCFSYAQILSFSAFFKTNVTQRVAEFILSSQKHLWSFSIKFGEPELKCKNVNNTFIIKREFT